MIHDSNLTPDSSMHYWPVRLLAVLLDRDLLLEGGAHLMQEDLQRPVVELGSGSRGSGVGDVIAVVDSLGGDGPAARHPFSKARQ